MSDTTIETIPVALTLPAASAESGHFTCCHNGDVSLCAQDVSDHNEVFAMEQSGCTVCDFLNEHPGFCPLGLVCPDDDDPMRAEEAQR